MDYLNDKTLSIWPQMTFSRPDLLRQEVIWCFKINFSFEPVYEIFIGRSSYVQFAVVLRSNKIDNPRPIHELDEFRNISKSDFSEMTYGYQ